MRKKTPAGPCRTLSAEQRAEIKRQLRVEGRLRTANKVELERLRAARRLRAASETAKVICEAADRADTTFEKMFCAQDEQGVTLRKAIAAARDAQFFSRTSKAATLAPKQVGGAAAQAVDNPKAALDQINELVAVQRRANPTLSEAQAFERVYSDPKNAALAARERAENRPTATAW
jgi:hypothetical protein